ncbi:MAG: YbdK family carboxylate-amine ligase [Bryobacterales bacterium]
MTKISFQSNPKPTLGVEIELALVDAETMALTDASQPVLARLPESVKDSVKPELMQCYLELNTGVCSTVEEARADLAAKLALVEPLASEAGARLYWTGTHPFSMWEEQNVTPNERYRGLIDLLQDMGRRMVTFGLHVHVGVDSGDKAVMVCERILKHLPLLLALSCNSPWWNNRVTGLLSHRSKIMEGLPTSGIPPFMRNWSEYVWLMRHLQETDFIRSPRDIWWMVRPHSNFGTVEVRVCDMPGSLEDVMAITALVQSLVVALSHEIDEGAYQHDCHPMLVRQNLWRAARYGLDAELVDALTHEPISARKLARDLTTHLAEHAQELGCAAELAGLDALIEQPTWAERQLAMLAETQDPAETVRRMLNARPADAAAATSKAP